MQGENFISDLPYSSTSMPSISLIGSSTARSARDGRLSENPAVVSSFGTPMSSMYRRRSDSGKIFRSSHSRKTWLTRLFKFIFTNKRPQNDETELQLPWDTADDFHEHQYQLEQQHQVDEAMLLEQWEYRKLPQYLNMKISNVKKIL